MMVLQVGLASDDIQAGVRGSIVAVDMSHLLGEFALSAGAFAGCGQLRNVVWPPGLRGMGPSSFEASGLEAADLRSTLVERIAEKAFRNCRRLSMVMLPHILSDVGDMAFEGCHCLPSVDLSGTRVTRIGACAFGDCGALKGICLPSSMEVLGSDCFRNSGVIAIDLRKTCVTWLSAYAFRDCTALREVSVPATLTGLDCGCVNGSGLSVLDLSRTCLRQVGEAVFMGCPQLHRLILPRSLQIVGKRFLAGSGLAFLDLSMTAITRLYFWTFAEAGNLLAIAATARPGGNCLLDAASAALAGRLERSSESWRFARVCPVGSASGFRCAQCGVDEWDHGAR
jgi:hypothetical protein